MRLVSKDMQQQRLQLLWYNPERAGCVFPSIVFVCRFLAFLAFKGIQPVLCYDVSIVAEYLISVILKYFCYWVLYNINNYYSLYRIFINHFGDQKFGIYCWQTFIGLSEIHCIRINAIQAIQQRHTFQQTIFLDIPKRTNIDLVYMREEKSSIGKKSSWT